MAEQGFPAQGERPDPAPASAAPSGRSGQSVGSPDAAAGPPPAAPPPEPSWSWASTALTLVVLAAVCAGTFWYLDRPIPTKLAFDGEPLVNAAEILDQAEGAFATLVEADGATPADGAGCWFAPQESQDFVYQGLRIACGPVLLGVSGTAKPWVIGRAQYNVDPDGVGSFGTFVGLESVADLDADTLAHPDGRDVPGTGGLDPPTGGIRTTDGRRLTGDEEAISVIDQLFEDAVVEAGASVSDDSACFFGGRKKGGTFLADGSIWCGPVLLSDSDPKKFWAPTHFTPDGGESFALSQARAPDTVELASTDDLPPDEELIRPDGREIPDGAGLEVPEAAPAGDRAVVLVEDVPSDVELTEPTDGRLVTPSRRLRLTGLGRTDRVGSGPEAMVAADDEILVVGAFESESIEGGGADAGTAALVVDGDQVAFADWAGIDGPGALVASVPEDADDVSLEVTFDGVAQTISLLTGDRVAGSPAALYREDPSTEPATQLSLEAAMPTGDPATATGVVSEARLAAWVESRGWAPEGKAFLVLTITGWSVAEPCCEVAEAVTTALFALTPTGGQSVDAPTGEASSEPQPVFEVPADFTTGTVEVRLLVSFRLNGEPGSAAGEPTSFEIEVPT